MAAENIDGRNVGHDGRSRRAGYRDGTVIGGDGGDRDGIRDRSHRRSSLGRGRSGRSNIGDDPRDSSRGRRGTHQRGAVEIDGQYLLIEGNCLSTPSFGGAGRNIMWGEGFGCNTWDDPRQSRHGGGTLRPFMVMMLKSMGDHHSMEVKSKQIQ